ncbi:aldo/keto reductase [Rhabdobacter roseus]|uniref:Aryl-alcohol dehydrogenase-like predicted oxidoreductase n=1 Tax=Rhabdobacter roseus TaxID=1655419 RepID=A0A840TLB4_9BACT|nr:aldo/keto reductase [Rhabdobacter roseus]MBB5282577.1 aryl-alcohol dehydrogenase-like predicted oxidoreductase [Rhabdobacter roseus]
MKKNTSQADAAGTLTLGSDLTVNRLGYGAMRITGEGIWGPPKDKTEAIRTLKRTLDLGINFIDTADSYGPHISEELIAEALHPYPDDLVIATKGGLTRTGPNQWPINGHPDHLREALEGSLKRLRLERIDLYQLHRFDPEVPIEDTLGFLKEQQDRGLIRHLGLSEVSVAQIRQAQELGVEVVSVQNMYNFAQQKWNDVLDWCAQNGAAFIPWYPLASGNLAAEKALEQVAQKHRATSYQVALAWLLQRSPAMLPIPGTGSVKHLEENTAAASLHLDDEDLKVLSRT